jgi:hypothetical protein
VIVTVTTCARLFVTHGPARRAGVCFRSISCRGWVISAPDGMADACAVVNVRRCAGHLVSLRSQIADGTLIQPTSGTSHVPQADLRGSMPITAHDESSQIAQAPRW